MKKMGVVGHTVLLQWTRDAPEDHGTRVATALNSLATKHEGVLFFQAGTDLKLKNDTADFGVFAVFATEEDYLQYAQDHRHVTIIQELIAPYRANKATSQIQLGHWPE